jgi:hypothetical protein
MWNGHGAGVLKQQSAAGSGNRNGGFFIGVAQKPRIFSHARAVSDATSKEQIET